MSLESHQLHPNPRLDFAVYSVMDIFELVASRKWQRLKATVFMSKSLVAKCYLRCDPASDSRQSILHFACHFRPPLDVIKCLYKAHPNAIFEKDWKQRYALHIACEEGCSFEVVQFLLQKNQNAANKVDSKSRTPFLLAFKNYVSRSGLDRNMANKELIRIGEILVEAAPVSPIIQDSNCMTAIEYALDGENDISAIKFVQYVSSIIKKEVMKNIIEF